jgi:hypothetical protein
VRGGLTADLSENEEFVVADDSVEYSDCADMSGVVGCDGDESDAGKSSAYKLSSLSLMTIFLGWFFPCGLISLTSGELLRLEASSLKYMFVNVNL